MVEERWLLFVSVSRYESKWLLELLWSGWQSVAKESLLTGAMYCASMAELRSRGTYGERRTGFSEFSVCN